MAKIKKSSIQEAPDQRKLKALQVKRLINFADVDQKEIEGLTIAQAAERLKWKVDPDLFLFRKICGKVVKKDPLTGVEYPIPFATVYVEDTDCHFVSFFPKPWPWGWFFPLHCHRETIGSTKTDQCGSFCVWIPRFDIDWILEWRKKRICFPWIFQRPSIADLLSKIQPPEAGPWPPIPWPDPGPLHTLTALSHASVEAVAGAAAGKVARRLAQIAQIFGAPTGEAIKDLNARAFETELPPPLPDEFHKVLAGHHDVVAAKGASPISGIRAAVAMRLGLDPATKELAQFDPQRFIGPFSRCYDILVPEWQLILDVPDITFRVTQDTNNDGLEENIYSESFFDVRWNAGPLPDVKLIASASAKESHVCETPTVPCGNVPALVLAGLMPIENVSYFDASTGYALRPNRPSTAASNPDCPLNPNPPRIQAQTPFCGVLNFFGCVNVGGAKFYRLLLSTDGGTTFSAITGLSWNLFHTNGTPFAVTADSNGWYAVLPDLPASDPNYLWPEGLVLEWPTPLLGQSVLKIETSNAAKNHIAYSKPVGIQSDNTYPTVLFTNLAWKFVGEPDTALRNLLGIPCPTIHRGATPKGIEVLFEVSVSAHHLRDACIGTSGCGSGAFVHQSGATSHWHNSGSDNSVFFSTRYTLGSTALEGAYIFDCHANSRAMNPDGQDGGNLIPPDWFEDWVYIYTNPYIAVAVVNED
jgi:hypothetical protein